jgi:hypothetical protein
MFLENAGKAVRPQGRRMNWPAPPPSRGDVTAAALVLLFIGLLALAFIYFSGNRGRANFGFGPDWDCTDVGKGDPVCIKRPPSRSVDAPKR